MKGGGEERGGGGGGAGRGHRRKRARVIRTGSTQRTGRIQQRAQATEDHQHEANQ